MVKKLLLVLIACLFVETFYSQCPTDGSLSFTTQSQIDQFLIDFPNCTELTQLVIDGQDVSSLSPLSNIVTLTDGVLTIQNTSLTSLEGLGSLTSVVDFNFINNDLISSFNPLQDIEIHGDIKISGNEILTSIDAFILIAITRLEITNNPMLYSCEASYVCQAVDYEVIPPQPPPGYDVYISNNAAGCNSIDEVRDDCNNYCPTIENAGLFTSQAQIDQFKIDHPFCTEIDYLEIKGNDITNLDGFSNIVAVNTLIIEDTNLEDLSGLENLEALGYGGHDFGYFQIIQNRKLQNLKALKNFSITTGLNCIMVIIDNPLLVNLDGLQGISTGLENTIIGNNDSLENLLGLDNVTIFSDNTYIENNDNLVSLHGLESVLVLGGGIEINNNIKLTDVSALDGAKVECILKVTGNTNIEALPDFKVDSSGCGYSLTIENNPDLVLCQNEFVCSILETLESDSSITVSITGNAQGCNSIEEVKVTCNFDCPPEFIQFTSQAQIDQFIIDYPNCTNLPFGLSISGDDIVNLNGFSNLESIDKGLFVTNCLSLKNLEGLNAITLISGGPYEALFEISHNPELDNFDALQNATSDIGMEIGIVSNPKLTSVKGLQSINPELYNLFIYENNLIASLEGLENLETLETFSIINCPNLQSLNGLQNLDKVTGGFNFSNNDQIKNFLPLSSVQLSGGLDIRENENLNSINGFVNVEQEFSDLRILNNPNLSVCAIPYICDLLNQIASDISAVAEISNNGADCQSVAMVEELCAAEAPSNDECENPLVVELDMPFTLNFDGSTASQIVPTCEISSDYFAKDVWVTFNSGNTVGLSINLSSQLKFQFYSGSCDNLTPLDGACYQGSLVNIAVEPNTDYTIQFWFDEVLARRQGPDYDITLISEQTLSLDDTTIDQLIVSPNPTSNNIYLHNFNESLLNSIDLFSIQGKLIYSSQEPSLDLSNLESGIYLLRVTNTSNQSVTKKIVKL